MVIAYHAIVSAYGFWLPNDPRGSWSDFVGSWELFKFGGPATKVSTRKSLAHVSHDPDFRRKAKEHLKYPPVRFDGWIRESIGDGFALAATEGSYRIRACCIGYDHAHIVVERQERDIEKIVAHLKSKASMQVTLAGIHPMANFAENSRIPTMWGEGCWKVFIDDLAQLHAAIAYVERHPIKEGLSAQQWKFVVSAR